MSKHLIVICLVATILGCTACAGATSSNSLPTAVPPTLAPPTASGIATLTLPTAGTGPLAQPTLAHTPVTTIPPEPATLEGTHLLLAIEGPVDVQRLRWTNGEYDPAYAGLLLAADDRLRIGDTGKAYILCADLHIVTIEPSNRPLNSICPMRGRIITRRGGVDMPGARPGAVPYILVPSNTALRTPPSILRWNDTQNAPYRVKVKNVDTGAVSMRETTVPTMTLALATPLKLDPDIPYRVEVTDNIGTSSLDPGLADQQTFRLLTAGEQAIVAGEEQRLSQQIDERQLQRSPALLLGTAYIYMSHELRADTVALIETLGSMDPALLLALADAYAAMSLDREAEPAYTAARLALAAEPSRWRRIMIDIGLARAFVLSGKRSEAADCLHAARALAAELADTDLLQTIDQYLPNLPPPNPPGSSISICQT